jgi:hypothetical protein
MTLPAIGQNSDLTGSAWRNLGVTLPKPVTLHQDRDGRKMATNAGDAAVDMDEELALLLQEQEQFMRKSKAPAAKVMRRSGGGAAAVGASASSGKDGAEEKPSAPTPAPVVGRVVERDVVRLDAASMRAAPPMRREATGFPSMRRRSESLFGKRQKQSAAPPSKAPAPRVNAGRATDEPADQERRDIDAANTARLNEMSPDEIREAQQELLQSLDPALVEKLRNRHRQSAKPDASADAVRPLGRSVVAGVSVVQDDTEEDKAAPEAAASEIDLSKITTEEQLQASARLLPPEERAKHEWMQSVPKTKQQEQSSGTSKRAAKQAAEPATMERFDFDGREMSNDASGDVPAHSGLFHHGDEPEAPGYTISELLHLARSSVASQRAMALTVIGKVLTNRQVQERENPMKVVPKVLPRELPVTLRISLDDQNYTALGAGVTALHSFLVPVSWTMEAELTSHQFELAFGTVLPPPRVHLHENVGAEDGGSSHGRDLSWTQREVIYIDDAPDEDGTTVSDEDMAAMDPVQALLHMDIGTRFRFILDSIQLPDQDAAEKMLDILVAIARHSPKGAREIATNSRLIKVLQQKFIENEDVLTLQGVEDDSGESSRALRLTLKALVLVRSLCQGERAAASILMSNGVIQSTKGFLALKGEAGGERRGELFGQIQIESLRIWRVLLGYALDFHCFAYLFPLFSGFAGADLVSHNSKNGVNSATASGSLARAAVPALFAALEAFSGLAQVHEAQHYFNQLSFFIDMAADQVAGFAAELKKESKTVLPTEQVVSASTALRFLSAASKLASKFHLESRGFTRAARAVDDIVGSPGGIDSSTQSPEGRDLYLALAVFHRNVAEADLLGDDVDEEEASLSFFKRVHSKLLAAATTASTISSPIAVIQASALIVTVADMATRVERADGSQVIVDTIFMAELYAQGLTLAEQLSGGMEFWISQLFTKLLFHRGVLRTLGLFRDEADATSLSNVLVPIYLALVNSTREQEEHSARHFAAFLGVDSGASTLLPRDKTSCNLRMPQYDQEYVSNNLPLPSNWMYCPFSRMEYTESKKTSADPTPSRAQSDEMKLIVSAACRFLYQFETLWTRLRAPVSSLSEEDKLFHLLHVFFAGSDVLFDEHVDTALDRLLAAFVAPVVAERTNQPRRLYDGMVRNLKRQQHLEGGDDSAASPAGSAAAATFTSDEQLVMTFVEKLVAEFASTSYANAHFARSVTLFLSADFPLAIRKWVWKELYDSRLLHALAPFSCGGDNGAAVFCRCALGAKHSDEALQQLMKAAVSQAHVSPERGPFAYALAIHHLAVYLFAGTSALSAARQQMVHELLSAPANVQPRVWHHLLRCALIAEPATASAPFLSLGDVASERVDRIRAQAALSADQREQFDNMAALAQDAE